MSQGRAGNFFYNLEKSAIITFAAILLLFSGAVAVTLIAPSYVDPTWTQPTSEYQVQMYEIADPHLYISASNGGNMQQVYHVKQNFTLLAFKESATVRIYAPEELQKFVTSHSDSQLKLTSQLLLLRPAGDEPAILAMQKQLQEEWEKEHAASSEDNRPDYIILELFRPAGEEAFVRAPSDLILENWVDKDFILLDDEQKQPWHTQQGVIYINNPLEYRISHFKTQQGEGWKYDPQGQSIDSLAALEKLSFHSRKSLIANGEHIFAIEGCWYCHTDQTRTLVQDVVMNGSAAYPAPPSSANEYIYQNITFAGTRRIGPDLSRVGIKRPSRDWHKSHFWSPKTASKGSIMPAFQHFFDFDPRGTAKLQPGIPNYQFESIFQYLMTKGTRITPPTQAWWLGLDPIDTKAIIEGKKQVP